jgi:hypothetical protein
VLSNRGAAALLVWVYAADYMISTEKYLIWFLRLTAALLMSALGAVIMPYTWMNAIHGWLSLGTLADQPICTYLTRSISALYAVLGACYWFISGDVRRYLPLLRFSVPLLFVFNGALFAIDVAAPMPIAWTVSEGVFLLCWTLALWWLVRDAEKNDGPQH